MFKSKIENRKIETPKMNSNVNKIVKYIYIYVFIDVLYLLFYVYVLII